MVLGSWNRSCSLSTRRNKWISTLETPREGEIYGPQGNHDAVAALTRHTLYSGRMCKKGKVERWLKGTNHDGRTRSFPWRLQPHEPKRFQSA